MKKILQTIAIIFTCTLVSFAQKDPVLFSVNDTDVLVSEFEYIYNKNNSDDAKYSEKSLKEYLDLYVNFKLKVEAAKDMGLDTIQELQDELAGYQKQLAESYLIDKQVKEKLLRQAYDRMQSDVDVSHILVKLGRQANPADTLKAYNKIMLAYNELKKKTDFTTVAKKYSEDKNSNTKGGRIGYIRATLPVGFYDVETAAYTTKLNHYSKPVRSKIGYHIIMPTAKRNARGEMEAAHILVRKPKKAKVDNSKERIDKIYAALKDGADWDEQVKIASEDNLTKNKKGSLGVFGINKLDPSFEDAAFNLKNDGDFSQPVESKLGWHIIKRLNKKDNLSFKQAKFSLDHKLKNDERIKNARQAMITKIRKNVHLDENKDILDELVAATDSSTFFTFKWAGFNDVKDAEMFTINQTAQYTVRNFEKYLIKEKGSRNRASRLKSVPLAIQSIYKKYLDKKLLDYEKSQLIHKYPDFKSLMREYDEGILLFEATKRKIWDVAVEDTIGLKSYYQANQKNYMWDQRAEVTHYQINTKLSKEAEAIAKYVDTKKSKPKDTYAQFSQGTNKLKYIQLKLAMDSPTIPDGMDVVKGSVSKPVYNKSNQTYDFYVVENLIEPTVKRLDEARGFVIANYQDQLEKEWLAELRQNYPVVIHKKVLKGLIK